VCEEAEDVADAHRLLEDELVDRHRGHAARHVARRQHGAGQVHLRHDPAAEDVAVAVGIGRHGDDLEHEFPVFGQGCLGTGA